MTAIKSQHSRVFARLLAEHQVELVDALIAGIPADHAAYRQMVGRIQGIGDALRISEQADFELSGDEPA